MEREVVEARQQNCRERWLFGGAFWGLFWGTGGLGEVFGGCGSFSGIFILYNAVK